MSEAHRLAFQARVANDLAAAHSAALVVLGDRLGLYRTLAAGAVTPSGLAQRTATHERYVLEWLRNQVASGYVRHDPDGRYSLADEQAAALAREGDRAFAIPAFQLAAGLGAGLDAVTDAFRTGAGLPPAEYAADVGEGIARGSRALWETRLVTDWLPADVADALRGGGAAADLGCGAGGLVHALAAAFPAAQVVGLDVDASAIERARQASATARVRFVEGSSDGLAAGAHDLVTCVDTLHDLPDPPAAAARVFASLRPGGCALVVEPCARWSGGPDVLARLLSAISLMYCVPVARSGGGEGRGALGTEEDLLELLAEAGFARRRVVERLPLHVVIEARR